MTTNVKAFIEITDLVDNAQGAVAGIGELSDYSRTFSTDKRDYSLDAYPGIDLIVFNATQNSVRTLISNAVKTKILEVANNIITNLTDSQTGTEFINGVHPELTNVSTSAVVEFNSKFYLQSLKFTYNDVGEDTEVELWFSDSTFRTEYPDREIRISPPLGTVNSLYDTYVNAKNALDVVTMPVALAQKESIRDNTSPTEERLYELRWVDPADPANTIVTYWTALCYGPTATISENILEAIRTYLTDNTAYTVEQWRTYFPEILTLENFVIVPLWDNTAKEVSPNVTPIYSQTTKLRDIETNMLKVLPDRTSAEIFDNGETTVHVWNNILMFTIAGSGNPSARNAFSKVYPDFTIMSFNDQNVNQISQATMNVIQGIETLLAIAEDYTPGSVTLPAEVTEYEANTRIYLEKTIDGMVIRLLTKSSYLTVISA
ncbi:virion structural protein [Vibrio phage BONAISHI]|nr:virion structural protein [Vibrio phage BONAISHI]